MSNGIGKNPLLDISKVYLQQVVEKKDDSYLEPDMKKRQKNNEKARKDMEKMGTSMKNPHFEEVEVDEAMSNYDRARKRAAQRAADRNAARAAGKTGVVPGVGYVSPRKERETYVDSAGTTRHKSGAKMEGLDPVGKEDGDVNNDGKKDSTDSYLMKRRKAIGKALASTKKAKVSEGVRDLDPEKGTAERKARLEKKRGMKMDDHPQFKKPSVKSESFSSWRNDLSEVMTDEMDDKPIKEKKVKNNIKINPKLGEAIEEIGGELIEAVEVDEAVYGGTPAKKEAPKDTRMVVTAADKKANTKAYQNYKAGDKRYKAADHMGEEVVDEAMRPGPRQRAMRDKTFQTIKKGGGVYKSSDRAIAHNVGVRGDVRPGDPAIKSRGGGGVKKDKGMGYGDQGAGNKARRRAGEQPMRGNRDPRNEEFASEEASMTPGEIALQKKKARLDRMIAMKRTQQLSKQKGGDAQPTKAMGEEASDAMKDRRMERGGVGGNTDYSRPPAAPNLAGKKKPKKDGPSALDFVKAQIRAKHGQGAIMDTKKK